MRNDTTVSFGFPAVARKKITAAFDGGRITSDGGVMLLAAAERRLGLAERLAGLIADPRNPAFVTHSVADILRARMLLIACGYEDADDLDHLRADPGFKLACGRLPDTGRDLCSQPTMSRWENAPRLREVIRLSYAMVDTYCASYKRPPATVTLAMHDTLDVVHGHQQCRCSMRIMMSAVFCRSMFMTPRQPDRWRCCCVRARRHRVLKSAIICAA
jgi:hypothetical protein